MLNPFETPPTFAVQRITYSGEIREQTLLHLVNAKEVEIEFEARCEQNERVRTVQVSHPSVSAFAQMSTV